MKLIQLKHTYSNIDSYKHVNLHTEIHKHTHTQTKVLGRHELQQTDGNTVWCSVNLDCASAAVTDADVLMLVNHVNQQLLVVTVICLQS